MIMQSQFLASTVLLQKRVPLCVVFVQLTSELETAASSLASRRFLIKRLRLLVLEFARLFV